MNINTIIKTSKLLRRSCLVSACALFASVSLSSTARAQNVLPLPTIHYAPAAPGHTITNQGSGKGLSGKNYPLYLRKNTAAHMSNCATADLVLDEGTGPFQRGRAIDFSANEANGGKVTSLASIPRADFGGLDSCTFTLWYKFSSPLIKGAYTTLIRSSCVELVFVGDELRVLTHGTTKQTGLPNRMNAPRNPVLSRENEWVFVAITWDGATGTTALYCGNEAARASVLKSAKLADQGKSEKGTVVNFGYHNLTDGGTRSFDGQMADIRFYTTALTSSQIEAVRTSAGEQNKK